MSGSPQERSEEGGEYTLNPLNVKHPLNDHWTFWYDNPTHKMSKEIWGDQLKQIYSFGTVEDFWSLWNNIKGANELKVGSNYHLFKKGISPKWEDPENAKGGKWVIFVKSGQRAARLNDLWRESALACIGASLEDCDEICGVVVSVRKQADKIAFWTRNGHKPETCKRIGLAIKELLKIEETIGYQLHEDSFKQNSSFCVQSKYEL